MADARPDAADTASAWAAVSAALVAMPLAAVARLAVELVNASTSRFTVASKPWASLCSSRRRSSAAAAFKRSCSAWSRSASNMLSLNTRAAAAIRPISSRRSSSKDAEKSRAASRSNADATARMGRDTLRTSAQPKASDSSVQSATTPITWECAAV